MVVVVVLCRVVGVLVVSMVVLYSGDDVLVLVVVDVCSLG